MQRLQELEYAVVDVETTGGSARGGHRVTEVAAILVDGGGSIVREFCTLVDPGRPIPPFVARLTGITDEMVRGAPRFAEVAEEVRGFLSGRVFVAHNAKFDWRFIAHELALATGLEPAPGRRLCTVRLARRVLPELESRSLDALSEHFGIENQARHRAYGDARATVVILRRLLERLDGRAVRSWTDLERVLAHGLPEPSGADASENERRR